MWRQGNTLPACVVHPGFCFLSRYSHSYPLRRPLRSSCQFISCLPVQAWPDVSQAKPPKELEEVFSAGLCAALTLNAHSLLRGASQASHETEISVHPCALCIYWVHCGGQGKRRGRWGGISTGAKDTYLEPCIHVSTVW